MTSITLKSIDQSKPYRGSLQFRQWKGRDDVCVVLRGGHTFSTTRYLYLSLEDMDILRDFLQSLKGQP